MIKTLLFIFTLTISSIAFSREKSIKKRFANPNLFEASTKIIFKHRYNLPVIFTLKNILDTAVFMKNLKTGIDKYLTQNKEQIISKKFVIK